MKTLFNISETKVVGGSGEFKIKRNGGCCFFVALFIYKFIAMALGTGLLIGSTALSLASSVFGGSKAAKAQEEANRLLEQQKRENQAWYERRYNEDPTQTASAQNMIRMAKDAADRQYRRAEGAAAVAGGTDEAVAQAKEAGNRMVADAVANIAAQGTARRDAIEGQYRQADAALTQQQIAAKQGKAQAISGAAGQAAGAFGNVAGGLLSTESGSELFKKLWT